MANLTPTNLLAGLALVSEKYQSAEWRMPDTAALSTAYVGEKTNPNLSALRTREDRTVNYDFPIRKSSSSGTARVYNHTGARTDSLRTALSWNSYTETFSISEKQLDNNTISYAEAFAKGVKSCVYNLLQRYDTWFIAQLLAGRTQYSVDTLTPRATWNGTDYVMELAATQADYWKEIIDATLSNNEFAGENMIISDSLSFLDMRKSLNQGNSNSTNLSYQYGQGELVKTSRSTGIVPSSGAYNGTAFAFPMDLAGLFFWIPKQNRKPLDMEKAMSYNGDQGQITIPIMDDKGNVAYTVDVAIHMYTQRADTSASNGSQQDRVSYVEISLDAATFFAPLSSFRSSNDSVIYAFGIEGV